MASAGAVRAWADPPFRKVRRLAGNGMAEALGLLGIPGRFARWAHARGLVTVLCLHRVSSQQRPGYPTLSPEQFRDFCRFLKQHYHVVRFRDLGAAHLLRPAKPQLILTFDDGLADFMESALPILAEEGLRANLNVISGCADTGAPFPWLSCVHLLAGAERRLHGTILDSLGASHLSHRRSRDALILEFTRWFQRLAPADMQRLAETARETAADLGLRPPRMLTWEEIRTADRLGFEIGAHTVSHYSLDRVPNAELDWELHHSKERIEAELGHPIDILALPAGGYDERVLARARSAGFRVILTNDLALGELEAGLWRRILTYGETTGRVRLQATGAEAFIRCLLTTRASSRPSRLFGGCAAGSESRQMESAVTKKDGLAGLVSVIVPAFNAASFLAETIESVLAQSYRHLELIVVDDGSTDSTAAVARNYVGDPRVRVVNRENAGVSAARNLGLAGCRGEFVAFLDADDAWRPAFLTATVAALERSAEAGVAQASVEVIDAGSRPVGRTLGSRSGHVLDHILAWDGTVLTTPSACVFRRSALERVGGFDTRLSTAADQDLCVRVAACHPFVHVPEPLVMYRLHPDNMHRNIARMEQDHVRVYRKAAADGRFRNRWFKRRCFSNLYLILAGSWWVDGGNRARGAWFLARALGAWPPNVVKVFGKLRRRL